MDDDSEFSDGEIVWVKLSYCWWPGEVLAGDRLTEEFLASLKRRPLVVVKFFDEDSYEYVKNTNFIYKYNCTRKNEFLRKGLEQYRAKNKHMIKFPADVMHAERATGGDPNIVNSSDFLPQKRESYADIFSPSKSKGKATNVAAAQTPRSGKKPPSASPSSPSKSISVIPVRKHEVRILMQASSPTGIGEHRGGGGLTSSAALSPVTPRVTAAVIHTNSVDSSPAAQLYHCHKCGLESSRQNVIVLHTKHCRAGPLVPSSFNIPPVRRETKPIQSQPMKDVEMPTLTPVRTPKSATPKSIGAKRAGRAAAAAVVEEPAAATEELVEVLQVVEAAKPTPGRGGRTPRAAAIASATPKVDRRRKRGRGKAAVEEVAPEPADADEEEEEEMELLMEVTDREQVAVEDVKTEDGKALDDSTGNTSSKGKADVELKNELLADWSEDEQDEDQELKEDVPSATIKPEPVEETDKAVAPEQAPLTVEKSIESPPQLASPVAASGGTTIKYRNIPKKQKREYIEVTNDQPSSTSLQPSVIEKSSSESSVSTAATCGETLSLPDKTTTAASSIESAVPEQQRPISAKQRILGRATRGSSSKSNSSEEPTTKVSTESQQPADQEPKKETSCFDFKEEEDEEVVLNKSPRRSLSNKRDLSLDAATAEDIKLEQEDLERAKKDAELKNEIDSLLGESAVPSLPELPPGPSSSIEQINEEIDRNRTLPPKERGKRIFKTRNKIIENEAIALEQSKAIVLDFVKKSHEEELKLHEEEKKLSSESPTTTNDDSQESVASTEPTTARFENSEFAAIKVKRSKLAPLPAAEEAPEVEEADPIPEESAVSSSNELKATPDSLPVSISKEQIALESLEKSPVVEPPPSPPKGSKAAKKVKSPEVVSPIVLLERLEPERYEDVAATPKTRKKRSNEMDNLDLSVLDIPRGRRGRSGAKQEEPAAEVKESNDEPVTSPEKNRRAKRAKKEEEAVDLEEQQQQQPSEPVASPPEIAPQTPKLSKSKRGKHASPQQRSADSTADLGPSESHEQRTAPVKPEPEPVVVKQQPIKMIIKSKGRKSNSELICEPVIVKPVEEPKEEEIREKLPKSPKSSKRKKTPVEDVVEEDRTLDEVEPAVVATVAKPFKSKRPKLKNDVAAPEPEVIPGPSATDLQIAEALIHLPEAAVPKPLAVVVQDVAVEVPKPTAASTSPSAAATPIKTINPRKRHLQKLMSNVVTETEPAPPSPQPKTTTPEIGGVAIPEKRKRETIQVVSVAPAPVAIAPTIDDDKFDIDNIPIVMDDSELLEESAISTTTSATGNSSKLLVPPANDDNDEVKLISTTKPTPKKIVLVKSSTASTGSNGSAPAKTVSTTSKKTLNIKSTSITIKPPVDQLSPNATRSPAHSPTPIRSAQLVQAGAGGQIVITSKGTVLTTQSPATSSAKTHLSAGPKTHVTHSTSSSSRSSSIVSSVVSSAVCTISSSTSKDTPAANSTTRASATTAPTSAATAATGSSKIKSPAKICVQSQEIIHPPTKPRVVPDPTPVVVQSVPELPTKAPKKGLVKKHAAEASASSSSSSTSTSSSSSSTSTSGERPLFTSKGAPITSAESPGMVEDKGKGKVLTQSGLKKFRQEQQQLQQQRGGASSRSERPSARVRHSEDEEPSTSTPTPPPSEAPPAEVVVAAAADSSVKELPVTPAADSEQQSPDDEVAPEDVEDNQQQQQPPEAAEVVPEENEADAAINEEPEVAESSSMSPEDEPEVAQPVEAVEPTESGSAPLPAEMSGESSSNVQESSQLIAVPAENFGGPANLFYLCAVREEGFVPVNNELLYLDASNQLVALPEQASVEDIVNQAEVLELPAGSDPTHAADVEGGAVEAGQQNILLNTQDGQQIILDQQSLMALAAGGDTSQLLTPDGQQILLQGSAQELLAALAVSQPGLGIVAAEGTQIIVAPESLIELQDAPLPGEIMQVNPSTTVETNAILTKPPIMSTVEVPTKNGSNGSADVSPEQEHPAIAANLDESLAAVIGVVPGNPNVPTSLELPITVTNPIIAKTTSSKIYQPVASTISTIGIDPAAAAAVLDLPAAVAQTGTDTHHVDITNNTHASSSSDEAAPDANGKDGTGEPDDYDAVDNDDDDEIIPTTPESQMNSSQADISSQFSDEELDGSVPIPDMDEDDGEEEDDRASNFSDVIPIQPNVVILRNVNNELLVNNNENSSDMELDPANPALGNEENTGITFDAATGAATANSAMVER